MSNETTAVENKTETAAAQSETVVSSPIATEVDYEAELIRKDAELAKVREEKENYRKGMLKAKGKLPSEEGSDDNDTPPDNWREEARRIAREEYLATKEAALQAEKDALVMTSAKKIKELTLALKNRSQVATPVAQGSNQDRPEVKTDSILSNDQISALKAKGWDDKKIESFKKNLLKK